MGCRGTVTGKSLTHENMYLVTLKTCGRLFENVPFLANELHPVGEATPGDIERAWTNPEEGVYDYQADYRESKN